MTNTKKTTINQKKDDIFFIVPENDDEIETLPSKLPEKNLELQVGKLRAERKTIGLKEQLALPKFCLDSFRLSERYFKFYTEYKTCEMFNICYTFSFFSIEQVL